MITINLVCVGNLKEKFWREAQEEYVKRLGAFCKINVIEIAEKNNENSINITLEKEGKDILSKSKGYTILMDRLGKNLSSEELAKKIEDLSMQNSEISFIIGSSNGVCEQVKHSSNEKISFGKNTFPHNLARVMLLEQIYRAMMISNNRSYHK